MKGLTLLVLPVLFFGMPALPALWTPAAGTALQAQSLLLEPSHHVLQPFTPLQAASDEVGVQLSPPPPHVEGNRYPQWPGQSDWRVSRQHPSSVEPLTLNLPKFRSQALSMSHPAEAHNGLSETVYFRYSAITLPANGNRYHSLIDFYSEDDPYAAYPDNGSRGGFFGTISSQPGYAFLASAVVPGLGQAANRQWWKTALFVTVEAAAIGLYIHNENRARSVERRFWRMADDNWSVVQYASWLVDYYNAQNPSNPFNPDNVLNPPYQGHGIPTPAFSNDVDWRVINLPALRQLERSTLYLTTGNPFSHDLPDYGSQQYYELISKYWQYGPGWIDWNPAIHDINLGNAGMPFLWLEHARIEEIFNDKYRFAGNMLTLLLMNHFVSAFDAFFTVRLRNHRMEASMSSEYLGGVRLRYRF